MTLSGTSMAAPHVTAVVANCIMSGFCASGISGVEKFMLVHQASRERRLVNRPPFGFSGDAGRDAVGRPFLWGYSRVGRRVLRWI